jgi:histidinol-phosphate aminotransferase
MPGCVDLRLDGNEGRAPDPALLDALRAAGGVELLRAYPRAYQLEELIAARHGVDTERVLVTAGGDEGLDRLFRAYADPDRNVVLPEPSFEMLPRYAALAGCETRVVAWSEGDFPVDAVLDRVDRGTAMLFVVTPNNPTGAIATADDLRVLAARAPHVLIVLDHAYAEFADDDLTEPALGLPNVVTVRTFSKAWGLAGLRVGYLLGDPDVIEALRTAGSPYAVAGPSLAFASAALRHGDSASREFVSTVRTERARLTDLLSGHGFRVPPSQGNFVLARGARSRWLAEALAGLGIAIRSFVGRSELDDAVRITCPGDDGTFERLCAGVDAALAPRALLFDLDGVLADVSDSYRTAIRLTAAAFGVELAPGDIRAAKAAGDANNDWELTRRLLEERDVRIPLPQVTEKFEELYQGTETARGLRENESPLVSASIWKAWSARYALGVVTGRPRADAERFLAAHGLLDACSVVVCMEDGPLKPDPFPVRLALDALGVTRAWFVGDTRDDLDAARAAGVVPIGTIAPGEPTDTARAHLAECGAARVLDRTIDLEILL